MATLIRSYPSLSVFLVAFGLRLIIVAGIAVFVGGLGVFGDDILYNRMAMQAAADETARWTRRVQFLYWDTAAFTLPLTGVYKVFGPVPWLGQTLVALFGAATAGLTTRLAMETDAGTRWAVLAGAVVAFLPSQVLFSALTLKDATVWAVLVALGVLVAIANRSHARRLVLLTVAGITLLVIMRYLRIHTLVVCVWGIAFAAWFGQHRGRLLRGVGAALLLVLLPLSFGLGPAGLDYIASAGSLEERRAANAQNAATAFVDETTDDPGSTETTGGEEGEEAGEEGLVADLAHLPYGLAVMIAAPFPWWDANNLRTDLARLAMIVWYPVLVLAAIGIAAVWRNRRALVYPVLVGGGMLMLYALAEGNFGTAYRHRGEFVWVVALLAAFGLRTTVGWLRERRGATD